MLLRRPCRLAGEPGELAALVAGVATWAAQTSLSLTEAQSSPPILLLPYSVPKQPQLWVDWRRQNWNSQVPGSGDPPASGRHPFWNIASGFQAFLPLQWDLPFPIEH